MRVLERLAQKIGSLSRVSALAVMGAGCVLVSSYASAQDEQARIDELYEAAKSEGELLIYSSTPASYAEALAAAFNKRFPEVEMKTFSATAAPLLERYMADAARGSIQADLVQTSDKGIQRIIEEGLALAYEPSTTATIPEDRRTLTPYAWPDRFIEHVAVYNIDLVSEDEAKHLESWDGVVDPRWKGRIAIADPNLVGGWYNGFYMLYKIKGAEWFEKLAALEPTIYNSNIPAVESVVSGQHAIALTIDSFASSYFKKGAPIRTKWPEPTPIWSGYITVSKDAPHPQAAKLFMEWFFTEEGMNTWAEIYQVTVARPGIPEKRAFADADWFTGAKSHYVLNPKNLAAEGAEALAAWNKAFGR